MSDTQKPPTKRYKRTSNGFEIFVCVGGSTFGHAEQLRGLSVEQVVCSHNDSAYVLNSKNELKRWGQHHDWLFDAHKDRSLGSEKSLIDEHIVQVSAGEDHFAAVGLRGAVYSWGNGIDGKLGHGNEADVDAPKKIEALQNIRVAKVVCGCHLTVFLSNKGDVYTCGRNIIAAENQDKLALPRLVGGLKSKHIIHVSACLHHVAAITDQFDLYTWGDGKDGRLGHSTEHNHLSPKLVEALRGKAKQVSCGGDHTAVIADDGLYTFGCNNSGQLGHGDKEDRWEPTLVVSLGSKVQSVSCGHSYTASVVCGSLFTWGGRFGLCNQDEILLSPKKVDALKDFKVSHVQSIHSEIVCGGAIAFVDPDSIGPSDSLPLVSALAKMINNEDFSDVSFLVENQQIFALKGVLVQRCPFFNAMFESGLSESTNHHNIPISNIKKEAFLLVLEFLYTDSVGIELGGVIDLCTAADMFQLSRLKAVCLESLEKDLTITNAASMLEQTAACGYEEPKNLCMKYVVKRFHRVLKTDGFKQLQCSTLLHEVIAEVGKRFRFKQR